MIELTETDFEILKFINKNEPVDIEKIKSRFSKVSSLEYRVSQLANPEYYELTRSPLRIPIENSSYIDQAFESITDEHHTTHMNPLGIYSMTDLGKKSLQDQKIQVKRKNMLYWAPIIIDALLSIVAIIVSIIALSKSK